MKNKYIQSITVLSNHFNFHIVVSALFH